MKLSKTLIAATTLTIAATTSTVATAVPTQGFAAHLFQMVIDPTNGDVYAAGNCEYASCGPKLSARVNDVFTFNGMTGIKNIVTNTWRTFFLTRNGNVYTTGYKVWAPRKIEFHNEVIDMASIGLTVGRIHYFIVREGGYKVDGRTFPMGSLWKWDELAGPTPVKVGDRNDWIMIDGNAGTIGVLNKNGNLWTFGKQTMMYGEGVYDDRIRRWEPTAEPQISGHEFRFISMGNNHMSAIDMQDRVWSWGSDGYGKLCNGVSVGDNLVPTLNGVENIKTLNSGRNSTLMISNDGKAITCGWHNLIYQGTSYNRDQEPRVIDFASATPASVSQGGEAYTFFDNTGAPWTWGQDTKGKLGNGSGNGPDDTETHFVGATKRVKNVDAVVLEGDVAWEPLVLEEETVTRTNKKGKELCNASANNGKGGNYEKTGMCDNGKGNGVGRMEPTKRTAFTMRDDGRGFKRSKK